MVVLGQGFPKKLMSTHKYREIFTLTATAGVFTTYQFSCNGMYDPNITGTGHQPMYFDQMTPLYDHYCVIGSKMKWKLIPATSNSAAGYVSCYIEDNASVNAANTTGIAELPTGQSKQICPLVSRPTTLTQKWSAKKYFGKNPLANTDLQGTSAGNPNEQSYFTVAIEGTAATTVSYSIEVEIEYIAIWKELRDVPSS